MLIVDSLILPLYGKNRTIPQRSGLNYWNASHVKNKNIMYIPIPEKIHKYKPCFFPSCDKLFTLTLPNQTSIICRVYQKKIISVPTPHLGIWLCHAFSLPEKELFTIDILENVGIDSILIDKLDDKNYVLNFKKTNSYEEFIMDFE